MGNFLDCATIAFSERYRVIILSDNVFPFLSVRLYTLSHRLAVTSLFGGCHDSVRLLLSKHNSRDVLTMVAADVSRTFGQQFTNALKVFVQHVPF